MRIEELSVGDWVMYDTQPYVVDKIGLGEYVEIISLYTAKEKLVMLSDLDPIHITNKILRNNGLEYIDDENDAIEFLCCDLYYARLCVGDTHWKIGIHSEDTIESVVCNIKYVHQLQHALRLAGIEKEIVL